MLALNFRIEYRAGYFIGIGITLSDQPTFEAFRRRWDQGKTVIEAGRH
jgi:hypothetical protein